MNTPNHPDETLMGKSDYSLFKDLKVNCWLLIGVGLSLAADLLFRNQVREWPTALRVMVATAPFFAILLWARSFTRWVQGMDEMHRHITISAVFFATGITFFIVTLWHQLALAGLFQATHPAADPCTVAHIFWLMTIAYAIGLRVFTPRHP